LKKKKIVKEIDFDDPISCLAFSPDRKWLATDSGTTYNTDVKLWDAEAGKEIFTFAGNEDYPYALAFSPDSTRLAMSSRRDGRVVIWNIGKKMDAKRGAIRFHLDGKVGAIAFSPDGSTLVVGSGSDDKDGSFLNVSMRELGDRVKARPTCQRGLTYLPTGKTLVSVQGRKLDLIDVPTGQVSTRLTDHDKDITCLAISDDSKTIATGSEDNTIILWPISILDVNDHKR
jgi:WD40 repeat protein